MRSVKKRIDGAMVALVEMSPKHEVTGFATGSLFRVAGRSFVITAAHCCRKTAAYERATLIVDPMSWKSVQSMSRIEANYDEDEDVAAWELDQESVEGLSHRTFLTPSDTDAVADQLPDDLFVLAGFPGERCFGDSSNVWLESAVLGCAPYRGTAPSTEDGFNLRNHLILHYQLSTMVPIVGQRLLSPRSLAGISGAAVWKLNANARPGSWVPGDARVVAIQTCVWMGPTLGLSDDHQVIRATRWDAVIELLGRYWPDVCGELIAPQ